MGSEKNSEDKRSTYIAITYLHISNSKWETTIKKYIPFKKVSKIETLSYES